MAVDDLDVAIIEAIASLAERGYQPAYRDVAERTGIVVSAVYRRCHALRKGGLINASPSIARSLGLTAAGRDLLSEHARARA